MTVVKVNEILGKVKPRLIVHRGQEASACGGQLLKLLDSALYSNCLTLVRITKHEDIFGLEDRPRDQMLPYMYGYAASLDFGKI